MALKYASPRELRHRVPSTATDDDPGLWSVSMKRPDPGVPIGFEPGQIRFVTAAGSPLAFEDRRRLCQNQRVGPSGAPGLMTNGELGTVEPAVHMTPAVRCEGPLEGPLRRVGEVTGEHVTQLAAASDRQWGESAIAGSAVYRLASERRYDTDEHDCHPG